MSLDTLMNWGSCCSKEPTIVCYPSKILHFNLFRYSSWVYDFPAFVDASGNPINISSYNFSLTLKKNADNARVIKLITVSNGLLITGASSNILSVRALVNISSGDYVYDLIGEDTSAQIRTYYTGKVKVSKNIGVLVDDSPGEILLETGDEILTETNSAIIEE